MKKTLMFTVLACILAFSGCGKGNETGYPATDESGTSMTAVEDISAAKQEKNEVNGEELSVKERISRDAVSGGMLTREDGSSEFVYIMADDTVVSEGGAGYGVIRRDDNALIDADGNPAGTIGLIELSPYRNNRVAVSLSERLDSRVGMMYEAMVAYMVRTQGFTEDNIRMLDCGLDADLQKEQIQLLLNESPDVIIVAPCDVNNISEITDMCDRRSVPIVYIMSEPDESEEIRWESSRIKACYAGPDGIRSGTDQGAIVVSLNNQGDINGDGVVKYIMLQGDPNDRTGCARSEYSVRELNENGIKTEMLLLQKADWEREKAKNVISDALGKLNGETEVIFCGNDEMALGAADAAAEMGLKDGRDLYIIGAVGNVEAMRAILDGRMTGTVFDDYKAQAEWAGNSAAAMIDGDNFERVFYTNPTKITAGNAASIIEYCVQ